MKTSVTNVTEGSNPSFSDNKIKGKPQKIYKNFKARKLKANLTNYNLEFNPRLHNTFLRRKKGVKGENELKLQFTELKETLDLLTDKFKATTLVNRKIKKSKKKLSIHKKIQHPSLMKSPRNNLFKNNKFNFIF